MNYLLKSNLVGSTDISCRVRCPVDQSTRDRHVKLTDPDSRVLYISWTHRTEHKVTETFSQKIEWRSRLGSTWHTTIQLKRHNQGSSQTITSHWWYEQWGPLGIIKPPPQTNKQGNRSRLSLGDGRSDYGELLVGKNKTKTRHARGKTGDRPTSGYVRLEISSYHGSLAFPSEEIKMPGRPLCTYALVDIIPFGIFIPEVACLVVLAGLEMPMPCRAILKLTESYCSTYHISQIRDLCSGSRPREAVKA